MLSVRPYRSEDRPEIADICLRTGDDGRDARGKYGDDRLLSMIYTEPYLEHEPDLAWVVQDGTAVVGYLLGTANTAEFAHWYRHVWMAENAVAVATMTSPDAAGMLEIHLNPERMNHPVLAEYPAHLHINLLPAAQGNGMGRALMQTFLSTLAAAHVPAVHLGMSATNLAAGHFYRRLGFSELQIGDQPGTTFYGRSTRS